MRFTARAISITGMIAVVALGAASSATAQNANIQQYRAAVTKVFLWKYAALPIFRLNPIFPGTVVRIDNETIRLDASRCYPTHQGGRYRGINDYRDGTAIANHGDLSLGGALLSKHLAQLEVGIGVRVGSTISITVSPLSSDRFMPDAAALRKIAADKECQLILRVLSGAETGYAIALEVLHGVVNFEVTLRHAANADAKVRAELLARIGKIFNLNSAAIGVGVDTFAFSVATSPAPQTLAIVPDGFSKEELSRITSYLMGKRGADLEIAVQEALIAADLGTLKRVQIRIQEILGDEELKNKESWAERMVNGKDKTPVPVLRTEFRDKVDFRSVATYAAAMQLLTPPRPPGM